MKFWKFYGRLHDKVLDCMEDRPGAAKELDAVLSEYYAEGGGLWVTFYLVEQAKSLLRAGDAAGAAASITRAMAELEPSGERWAEAELHRIDGEIHLFNGNPVQAAQSFTTAICVARDQEARSLESRAVASLDRVRSKLGT